ncbi:hypothetical protein VaNZ11_005037 [Volvox africanus]|uniref:Amidohydrolase-related domain-containing protein n=1 Tax=Volvox africanus TaxID=51714 RepID=A0ABQ5RYE0_9CHLO|nr:hypothetical protein VaNZ11_005037 [Volvox africanus]
MLKLRLLTDGLLAMRLPTSRGGDRPDYYSSNSSDNLMPEGLCINSFSRACAMRKALQQFRATTTTTTTKSPPASSFSALATGAGLYEAPWKKPCLVQTSNVPTEPEEQGAGTAPAMLPSEPPAAAAAASPASTSQPRRPFLELPLLLTNCRVLDVMEGGYMEGLQEVLIQGRLIKEVRPMGQLAAEAAGAEGERVAPAVEVDCGGAVLMPGLCDAHVHCTAVTADLAGLMSLPESYVAMKSAHILAGMLARGFTTVRDAGGADFGLAQAVEEGLVLGPRILFTGHALSQTGGHGDFRGRGEEVCACGAALRGIGRVCDGDAEVRRAARDELRRGAHCIKVMASGGVASPTDRLTNTQFSEAEMTAIVEEATAAGTYVCAHAYKPSAIQRAVRCGVKSIEHGNYLDETTADCMSQRSVVLVPTLVTYHEIARRGVASGMPEELVAKVGDALEAGLRSLSIASKSGLSVCFGSDLLGDMHSAQALEFELRSRVLSSPAILRSATVTCAWLFGMQNSLGQVRPGYIADLLLLRPGLDPLADVAVLATPGGAAVAAVFKEGLLAKAPLLARAPAGAGCTAAANLDVKRVSSEAVDGDGCSSSVMMDGWADLNQRLLAP